MRRLCLLGVIALTLVACGAEAGGSDSTLDTTSTNTPGSTSTTETPSNTDTTMPAQPDATDAAKADLADRLDIDASVITTLQVQDVQWPDGSLGCPEEGQMYTQAIVDGQQILLDVEGRIYDYRSDGSGMVRLCPSADKDGGYDFVPPPGIDT